MCSLHYYNITFSTGLFLHAFSVIVLVQLYSELQGRAYKCGSLNNIFSSLIYAHSSAGKPWEDVFFFVTWEAFLLLAGLLEVSLLLPVDEISKVCCQELVVQCTAAVCQAVQQCKCVHQSLSGVCAALSASLLGWRCWCGDPDLSVLARGLLVWRHVLLCEPGGMQSCRLS